MLRPVLPTLSRGPLAAIGVALGVGIAAWLLPMTDSDGLLDARETLLVSGLFLLAGVIAADRRPANPTGLLLIAYAVLHALSFAREETLEPWRYTIGVVFADLDTPVLALLVLMFPAGRLPGLWDRLLAGSLFVVIWAIRPFEAAWSPPAALCSTCPPSGNLLYTGPAPFDRLDALAIREDIRIVLIALVFLTLIFRWVRASRPARRLMAPLVLTTALLAAKVVADQWFIEGRLFFSADYNDWIATPNLLLTCAIPVAFLLGLLQTRVTRSTIGRLLVELQQGPDASPLRDVLARALGDSSLRVGLWVEPLARYVDVDGHPVELPPPDDPSVASAVSGDHGPLAVLVHDRVLLEDPQLVEAVAAAARFALENERLRAEVRAQLAQVSQSRTRIVAAADAERRRIERDLHDGAQQRLVSLGLALRLVRVHAGPDGDPQQLERLLDSAGEQAQAAIDELRDLARGIHPSILTEDGLAAALEALAHRAAVPVSITRLPERRLDPAVEATAYFVCSEAITNAAKHASASVVRIDVSDDGDHLHVAVRDDGVGGAVLDGNNSGLRGLADRVEAAGGVLTIESPPGGGTRLAAGLPITPR